MVGLNAFGNSWFIPSAVVIEYCFQTCIYKYTLLVWVSVCLYPIKEKTGEPIEPEIVEAKELSFPTNSNLLIPISLQPDGANLLYFKLRLFYL